MNENTKKVALACFIGGFLFTVTAFCLAPMFWWLGTLAGLAGGYFGYRFHDALRAVPEAWRAAKLGAPKSDGSIGKFLRKPRPFMYSSFLIGMALVCLSIHYGLVVPSSPAWSLDYLVMAMFLCGFFWYIVFLVIHLVCLEGDIQLPVTTYGKAFSYFARGIGRIALFFTCTLWVKYLPIGVKWVAIFTSRFVKYLFVSLYSKERALCSVFGTLGGVFAYLWSGPLAETFMAKAMVSVFGGLLGAGLGVINYELVSKKWLKLVPQA